MPETRARVSVPDPAAARAPAAHAPKSSAPRERMRALLLTARLLDSAGGRSCTDLALGLARRGLQPVVCCYAGWGPLAAELARAGVDIFPLRMREGVDPGFSFALARELRRRDIDVVHSFNARRAYVLSVAAGFLARTRVGVATFRETPDSGSPAWRLLGRLSGEVVGALVATSEEVRDALYRQRWVPAGKTIVLPDGVNPERFAPAGRREPARAHWGIAPDVPLVGAIVPSGREAELEWLLAALAQLRRTLPRAELVLAGFRGAGPGWRALGAYTDSPAFYAAIDALAIPRAGRSVPLVLLEALAAGVPVAACSASAADPRAPAGPWAFAALCEPTPSGLARALAELLTAPEDAHALVREGSTCVREDYSIDAHVERVIALYRDT